MGAEILIANMLRIAAEDLDGARSLAALGNRNAIYLCEQAAEKVIRAILTTEGKHAGIKHRLNEMVDDIPDENPLKPALRQIEELSAYATAYRYPTSAGRILGPPSADVFADMAKKVDFALGEATSRLKVDLSKKGAPAGSVGPIR